MTAKRFIVPKNYRCIQDNFTKEHYLCESKTEAINLAYLLNELHEEKEMWKRECKRLKGWYYLENENVELEDIIGLVKTNEPTNSVELKKELYK